MSALARPDTAYAPGFTPGETSTGASVVAKRASPSWPLSPSVTGSSTTTRMASHQRVVRFKTAHVFAIAQADGEPLPEQRGHRLTGDDPAGAFERLQSVAMSLGFSVVVTDDVPPGVNGDCSHANCIRVRLSNAPAQQAKTLAHELGHAILQERHDNRAIAECEAESIAYV
jgi:hypothetical protein